MTFDQIQSFYLAATLGTYRQVAERLNTTQPTISARIVALEEQLGTSLFDRSGRRVALTPQGRLFFTYAEKLLEIRAEATQVVGNANALSGIVRIGASDTMAITWIPDFLFQLRRDWPDAVIELHVGASHRLWNDLMARKLDIAFLVGPVEHADVVSQTLCTCPLVFAASPDLELHHERLTLEDIAKQELFTLERLTQTYQVLRRLLSESVRSAVRLNPVNSLQTIVLLVEKGLGAGAIPLAAIEKELAAGSLVLLETDASLPDIPFCISYPTGPDMSAAKAITTQALQFLKRWEHSKAIKIVY